jgi:(1->4)-alpha-D-glucan 1-alpha-D-glucosylmutase
MLPQDRAGSAPVDATIPTATYRLQLSRGFDFAAAAAAAEYLASLGVSHLYLSPVARARAGSLHGYDVVDHEEFNPELGGEAGFRALAARARELGMGLLLDLVPNHMCIVAAENRWWSDVLENGESSPYAAHFDIDWNPPKQDLRDKVLLPILGRQYGLALESGELGVRFEAGAFVLSYFEHRLPLAPRSWRLMLEPALEALSSERGEQDEAVLELESILTAIRHLPRREETAPERARERRREKEIAKRRLQDLVEKSPTVARALERSVAELNDRGSGLERLEALLEDQVYRLSHWRVATDEINYRRFFDVNELAAIRVEEPAVFDALHALPFAEAAAGRVDGFRVDHVDGLLDPAGYLARLPSGAYRVVEKILASGESLPEDWPVHGTTGYDFLGLVNGLFVDPAARGPLVELDAELGGAQDPWPDVVYECKKLVLDVALSAELTVLARRLDRISEQHRSTRDFTLNSLQTALAELIACFPGYRSYVPPHGPPAPGNRAHVWHAGALAGRRNPAVSRSIFDFLTSVLLLEEPEGLSPGQSAERRDFVLRFQQLTGPVAAKGVEDTAFYRFHPLASLAEVGGDPSDFGFSLERFHRACEERQRRVPHTLNATSTHDSKRDEDVRCRIDVISEVPELWRSAVTRWRAQNARQRKSVDEAEAPDGGIESLFYQTLFGAWPASLPEDPGPDFRERISRYVRKALREAKLHSSWVNPNAPYEEAVDAFVSAALDPSQSGAFLADLTGVLRGLLTPGLLNAVSQQLVKAGAPGVPDLYQGTELPEFRLVDPDNRGSLDVGARARRLAELQEAASADPAGLLERLLQNPEDGCLKLFVTSRALRFRREHASLFGCGSYQPVLALGARAEHVVAFARRLDAAAVLVVAARFFTRLPTPPIGREAWAGTSLPLSDTLAGRYRDALSGRSVEPNPAGLPLDAVFARLPFALLERVP